MRRVFLDTNFLINLVKFNISLEELQTLLQEKVELFILSSNIQELQEISKQKGKTGNFAKLALEIIKLKNIRILKKEESPDKAFLNLGNKNTIIATNDSSLRKKLNKLGIRTIYVRGKKKLEVS